MNRVLAARKSLGYLVICVIIVHVVLQHNVIFEQNLQANENLNDIRSLKEILGCMDRNLSDSYLSQRGKYWIRYNYFTARRHFRCDESITYTTHTDFTYLNNLLPLLERWQGPVSVAMYSPGTDFKKSVQTIQYLRECSNTTLVKDLVTFHLILDQDHMPKEKNIENLGKSIINCNDLQNNKLFDKHLKTYKKTHKLLYPINVARNVAKESATTHFVFASDIELYPNPGLIEQFLEMIQRNDPVLQTPQPKVFVLAVFEVAGNVSRLPNNKNELITMLRNESAIPFHKNVCLHCHQIPKASEWMTATDLQSSLHVFHVGKRYEPYQHWEPFYIGTRSDPLYDERLSWEGQMDKMTQGYILCVMDYEFLILDNAFLVHSPGFKFKTKTRTKHNKVIEKQTAMIRNDILSELRLIYGAKPGCVID